jgi:hypothetical protein
VLRLLKDKSVFQWLGGGGRVVTGGGIGGEDSKGGRDLSSSQVLGLGNRVMDAVAAENRFNLVGP